MARRPQPTTEEIERRLEAVEAEMISASFARDERAYYELYEERGELRHMLKQLRSTADEDAKQPL